MGIDPGAGVQADLDWIAGEAALVSPDNGIVWTEIQVDDRGEVQVDTDCTQQTGGCQGADVGRDGVSLTGPDRQLKRLPENLVQP